MEDFLTKLTKGFLLGVLIIVILALASFITGLLVMLLWNWLMPDLFNLPTISFIQGWGISFLSGLLFRTHTKVKNDN